MGFIGLGCVIVGFLAIVVKAYKNEARNYQKEIDASKREHPVIRYNIR